MRKLHNIFEAIEINESLSQEEIDTYMSIFMRQNKGSENDIVNAFVKKYNTSSDKARLAYIRAKKHLNECIHYKLDESILDIPKKEYATWLISEDGKINKEIKKQIYSILRKWRDQINFKFDIDKIEAKGSLLSKRYTEDTDLDISVYTNMTKEQRDSVIDIRPQGNKIIVDGKETNHPLDFFILADGEHTPEENLDNIYDVANEKWIKRTEEYENEIPLNHVIQASNFFINGCTIALTNYENDKVIYEFYKNVDVATEDIDKDEKEKALIEQRKKLQADLDALNMAIHMISSFRQEAYNGEDSTPFEMSIEIKSKNPHISMNEQLAKILEKFGIRQKLREKADECKKLLEGDMPHEEEKQKAEEEFPKD